MTSLSLSINFPISGSFIMKLNQVPGIFQKLLELTLEFLSGSGWVCESLMPNFGQHTKHFKNSASNFHDAKFLGTLEPLLNVEFFPLRIPSITKLWCQTLVAFPCWNHSPNFGAEVSWTFHEGTSRQSWLPKFSGDFTYGAEVWWGFYPGQNL
jgi:hypothetical protein